MVDIENFLEIVYGWYENGSGYLYALLVDVIGQRRGGMHLLSDTLKLMEEFY